MDKFDCSALTAGRALPGRTKHIFPRKNFFVLILRFCGGVSLAGDYSVPPELIAGNVSSLLPQLPLRWKAMQKIMSLAEHL